MRMVITLLETCGHYFDRGSSKRKLDRFLVHFQRYILSKGALPLDIEFDLQVGQAAIFFIPFPYYIEYLVCVQTHETKDQMTIY